MRGVTRKTLDTAGGVELNGGQNWFTVDDQPVVLHMDPITPHGPPPHSPDPRQLATSNWLNIDGKNVAAQGDPATCGHIATGSNWFFIP